jgi:hypothetical protein
MVGECLSAENISAEIDTLLSEARRLLSDAVATHNAAKSGFDNAQMDYLARRDEADSGRLAAMEARDAARARVDETKAYSAQCAAAVNAAQARVLDFELCKLVETSPDAAELMPLARGAAETLGKARDVVTEVNRRRDEAAAKLADVERKCRGLSLDAAMGDTGSVKSLKSATGHRNEASSEHENMEVALQQAQKILLVRQNEFGAILLRGAWSTASWLFDQRVQLAEELDALVETVFRKFDEYSALGGRIKRALIQSKRLSLPQFPTAVVDRSSNHISHDGEHFLKVLIKAMPNHLWVMWPEHRPAAINMTNDERARRDDLVKSLDLSECAKQGIDWEENLAQRDIEVRRTSPAPNRSS